MILDLQNIRNSKSKDLFISLLSRYPKFKSIFVMASVGLPVSKSMIITDTSEKTKKKTEKLIDSWNSSNLLIRTDKKGGAINAPAVQNCKPGSVWENAKKFINEGFLVMVMAEGDIYHNTYSINMKIEPFENNSYYLEIVGPGFCSTDLNKRDIVQERGYLTGAMLINSRFVSPNAYNYQKRVLIDSIVGKETAKGNIFKNRKESGIWVRKYLRSINAFILKNPSYIPISQKYLGSLWNFIPKIRKACRLMGYENEASVVSMSFVYENGSENPYFWKIHPFLGYKKRELQP